MHTWQYLCTEQNLAFSSSVSRMKDEDARQKQDTNVKGAQKMYDIKKSRQVP